MKRKLKKLLIISGAIISFFLLLIIIASLIFFFNKSLVKGFVEKFLANRTGAELEIGKLDYELFPLNVQADSVKVFQNIGGMKIDIFLNQLSIRGKINRLLKKQKPFFQSIEITGAVCRVDMEEIGEEVMEIDYQRNMLLFSNFLSYVDRIDLKDVTFQYITSSNNINFEKCNFLISSSGRKGEFDYSLSSEKAEVKNISRKISLESSCRSTGKFSFIDNPSVEGKLLFASLDLKFIDKEFLLPEIALKFKGEFPLDGKILFFPQFEMHIPPLVDASGYLRVDLREDFSLASLSRIYLKDLSKTCDFIMPYLKPYLPPELKALNINGAAYIEGEYQYVRTSSGEKTDIKGLFKLEPAQISCLTQSFSFKNSISGELRVKGSLPDVELSGALRIKNGSFLRDNLEIRDFSLDFSVNGTSSFLDTSPFKGNLKGVSFSYENKKIELDQVEFNGQGSFDVDGGKVNLSRLELQIPPLPPFHIRSKMDLMPHGERYFHLKSSKIDSASLLTLFSSFVPRELSEWEPSGYFDLEIEASYSPQDADEWSVSFALDLSEGTFHNPSFTIAGESLNPEISLKGKYRPLDECVTFSAVFNLSRGESLWNEYYVDWSKYPFRGNVTGVYHIPLKKLDDLSIEALPFSIGRINAQGLLKFQDPHLFDLKISASKFNLRSLYSLLSPEQAPEKSALDLQGEAEGQVHFKKENSKLSLFGQFLIKNGSIKKKDIELLMDGIEVKIPVCYESGIKRNDEKEEPFLEKGYFIAGQFKTPYLSIAPFRLDFQAGRNKFMIEPVTVKIFGGTATLGKSVFSIDSEPSGISGILSFSLSDVDISKFPIKSDQFNLSGTIRANLSRVEINPEMLATEGRCEVDIFDTQITVQNIKIAKPFSKNRTISCDVDFKELNLEKLTDSIPFGRVTGFLNGEIKDLAISYGQPESFIMSLESVARKGVPQKFSLGAVNDLSVLSSGEETSISSKKGFARFISEFGYKKIGIFCSLKNDMFTLRGTIREKGVEYLVKRSWLFGISVVNKKPRNRIRFKDMMNRLKRIGRSKESQ